MDSVASVPGMARSSPGPPGPWLLRSPILDRTIGGGSWPATRRGERRPLRSAGSSRASGSGPSTPSPPDRVRHQHRLAIEAEAPPAAQRALVDRPPTLAVVESVSTSSAGHGFDPAQLAWAGGDARVTGRCDVPRTAWPRCSIRAKRRYRVHELHQLRAVVHDRDPPSRTTGRTTTMGDVPGHAVRGPPGPSTTTLGDRRFGSAVRPAGRRSTNRSTRRRRCEQEIVAVKARATTWPRWRRPRRRSPDCARASTARTSRSPRTVRFGWGGQPAVRGSTRRRRRCWRRRPDRSSCCRCATALVSAGVLIAPTRAAAAYIWLHHLLAVVGAPIGHVGQRVAPDPSRDGDADAANGGLIADRRLGHDRPITSASMTRWCVSLTARRIRCAQPRVRAGAHHAAVCCRLLPAAGLRAELKLTRLPRPSVSHRTLATSKLGGVPLVPGGRRGRRSTFEIVPQAVAHDLHPDYLSTTFAPQLAEQRELHTDRRQVAARPARGVRRRQVVGVEVMGDGLGVISNSRPTCSMASRNDRYAS